MSRITRNDLERGERAKEKIRERIDREKRRDRKCECKMDRKSGSKSK
jgi:hypothetical protein